MAAAAAAAAASAFRDYNAGVPTRQCLDPDSRLGDVRRVPNRAYNQHTRPASPEARVKDSYIFLIKNSAVAVSMPPNEQQQQHSAAVLAALPRALQQQHQCWVLKKQAGIDIAKAGYARFAHDGSKVLAHVFVYLYHRPGHALPPNEDVSHLCSTPNCIRPAHLCSEPRAVNVSRISCHAILVPKQQQPTRGGGQLPIIRLCRHTPRCVRIRSYGVEDIIGGGSSSDEEEEEDDDEEDDDDDDDDDEEEED
jgi:hypothetical protein